MVQTLCDNVKLTTRMYAPKPCVIRQNMSSVVMRGKMHIVHAKS